MGNVDIFGDPITPEQAVKASAVQMDRELADLGAGVSQRIASLYHEFGDFETVEYAMARGRPGLMKEGERAYRLYGESWKEYAIREARIDSRYESARAADSIQPQ